jgi:translin
LDRSDEVAAAGDSARGILEEKHQAREITFAASRRAIRSCASAIRAAHRGDMPTARELIAEAAAYLSEADVSLSGHPDVRYHSLLHDAQKEFAEANLTLAYIADERAPTAEQLHVETAAYLNGMGEAASELRRQVLDCLRRDELERAETLLATMDQVYGLLMTVDYPDAITGGLRRTTDQLRGVLERTRGDVTNALVAARLRRSIDRDA